jgi:hypothetical protein
LIRGAALALATLLSACATITTRPPDEAASELTTVPFFPQETYQCGPAALATLLVHSGVAITPEALVPQVYLPGREGSLQVELLAATRRSGRIPFILRGGAEALFEELEAGNPVLVLQNLGRAWLPRWHYAVVVGYQPDTQRVLLRSGTEKRRLERWSRFIASWAHADYWGLVIPRPGEIPASGPADDLAGELAGQEALLEPALVAATWDAALARWPDNPNLLFAAANARRANADTKGAAQLYHTLLMQAPQHMPARNNFADLLVQAGCPVSAERLIAPAQQATPALSPAVAEAVRQTAADIARQRAQVSNDPGHCRALTQDPTLP